MKLSTLKEGQNKNIVPFSSPTKEKFDQSKFKQYDEYNGPNSCTFYDGGIYSNDKDLQAYQLLMIKYEKIQKSL